MKLSQLFYAYSLIYLFCKDPFTNVPPKYLFDASVFVFIALNDPTYDNDHADGISLAFVLYTMAKNAQVIGIHNVSKFAYKRLSTFNTPFAWRDRVALETLLAQVSILLMSKRF